MKIKFFKTLALFMIVGSWVFSSTAFAASPSAALLKAKREAEAKGYIFETSHDEIVAKAKKEGKLRVLTTMRPAVSEAMRDAFKRKYPFIDIIVAELGRAESAQRFLLELKAGGDIEWDVNRLYTEFYEEYLPFQKRLDILGMVEQGVLNIYPKLVDPVNRNVVTMGSNMNVVAYNKKLISEDKVPDTWEDFLKPEFKERKFVADIRPIPLAVLVPAWGLERTLEFARKIAAQDPIWGRGHTRNVTAVFAGEYPLFLGPNFGATKRVQAKDPTGILGYKILEPIPVRLHEGNGVLATADYPYAALLWLEFQASPEGQKIMDKYWPFGASLFTPGSAQEKLTRGRRLSVIDWNHYKKLGDYTKSIVKAYGFPTAERRRR